MDMTSILTILEHLNNGELEELNIGTIGTVASVCAFHIYKALKAVRKDSDDAMQELTDLVRETRTITESELSATRELLDTCDEKIKQLQKSVTKIAKHKTSE